MEYLTPSNIKTFFISSGVNLGSALLILFIGFKLANLITKKLTKLMDKNDIDSSLKPFLSSVISWALKVSVVIAAASSAGIQTTSFLAILGTAGLAIGMALQGSLSNFAGGVLILILKPFKVGDVIKAQGFVGCVEKITTFSTFLKTPDNQVISLPNAGLANSPIVNINKENTRRVDFTFGIGYNDNIKEAKDILAKIVDNNSKVLDAPDTQIVVGELADSSVNIIVRAWVNTPDYWDVYFEVMETVKIDFDKNNISIPFPQTDIHIHQDTK
jgi:small conductance mechanosensitive channel